MNWIQIDEILYGMINRHDTVEGVLKEAKVQFKWNDSQANAAVIPLLRHNTNKKMKKSGPDTIISTQKRVKKRK